MLQFAYTFRLLNDEKPFMTFSLNDERIKQKGSPVSVTRNGIRFDGAISEAAIARAYHVLDGAVRALKEDPSDGVVMSVGTNTAQYNQREVVEAIKIIADRDPDYYKNLILHKPHTAGREGLVKFRVP